MANSYDQITTITQDVIIPKLEDNIFDDASFLKYVMGSLAKVHTGGTQLNVPVIKAKDSQGGSYGRGDTFSTSAANTRDQFVFDWKAIEQPIVVFGIDMAMNAGVSKVIDHVKGRTEEAMMNLKDKLATMLFADGTGNGSKDFTGLRAIVDDGTNVATYGGKTRATDTWAAAGYTGSVGAIAFSNLQTAHRAAKSGSKKPNLIVTTETIYDDIEDLMTPTLANNVNVPAGKADSYSADNGLKLSYGATEMSYRGMPIVADEYCGSGRLFMLNTDRLQLHVLKQMAPNMKATEKMAISMTPMQRPDNQDGVVAHLLMYGEFATSEPRTLYQLNGIT